MARSRTLIIASAIAAATAVTGCGVANPYQQARSSTASSSSAAASTKPATTTGLTSDARSPRADAVLARYADLAINWTSRSLAADQRRLAALARGPARAQALQTAATYGRGSQLQRSKVTNRGQVTSIAPGRGARRGEWVITTEERTAGSGDYVDLPAQAHVYYARVDRLDGRWAVSTWSPQN